MFHLSHYRILAIVMSLKSSEDDQSFESLKNLLLKVNENVDSQDYAVMLTRIKKFKLEIKNKT
jgi:hypothetical protein